MSQRNHPPKQTGATADNNDFGPRVCLEHRLEALGQAFGESPGGFSQRTHHKREVKRSTRQFLQHRAHSPLHRAPQWTIPRTHASKVVGFHELACQAEVVRHLRKRHVHGDARVEHEEVDGTKRMLGNLCQLAYKIGSQYKEVALIRPTDRRSAGDVRSVVQT